MELSHRITNEISGITKAKVSSAVVKKRSLLGVPTSNKNLPINSPLITNRGINRLQDLSNAMTEQNKMSTPSLPARSGGLNLVKDGQFQMNKIIRKDMPPTKNETKQNNNDDWQRPFQIRSIESKEKDSLALKKPPLPKEKAEQKSESKINTTMETTPDINEGTLRRLNFTDDKEEEEKLVPQKPEEKKTDNNLRVFDRLSIPEETREVMLNRKNASFTPGINKRRLKRDTNATIDSTAKPVVPINALPEISLTKPKGGENSGDSTTKSGTTPIGFRGKDDPLLKF